MIEYYMLENLNKSYLKMKKSKKKKGTEWECFIAKFNLLLESIL